MEPISNANKLSVGGVIWALTWVLMWAFGLAASGCGISNAVTATTPATEQRVCSDACARELHPLAMSRIDGEHCLCWAPVAEWEAPRASWARLTLPRETRVAWSP